MQSAHAENTLRYNTIQYTESPLILPYTINA